MQVSINQATSGDPRRPENVYQYNILMPPKSSQEERPPDVPMVMAAVLGMVGVYMKVSENPFLYA